MDLVSKTAESIIIYDFNSSQPSECLFTGMAREVFLHRLSSQILQTSGSINGPYQWFVLQTPSRLVVTTY